MGASPICDELWKEFTVLKRLKFKGSNSKAERLFYLASKASEGKKKYKKQAKLIPAVQCGKGGREKVML